MRERKYKKCFTCLNYKRMDKFGKDETRCAKCIKDGNDSYLDYKEHKVRRDKEGEITAAYNGQTALRMNEMTVCPKCSAGVMRRGMNEHRRKNCRVTAEVPMRERL
jgi:hypothetical protein